MLLLLGCGTGLVRLIARARSRSSLIWPSRTGIPRSTRDYPVHSSPFWGRWSACRAWTWSFRKIWLGRWVLVEFLELVVVGEGALADALPICNAGEAQSRLQIFVVLPSGSKLNLWIQRSLAS